MGRTEFESNLWKDWNPYPANHVSLSDTTEHDVIFEEFGNAAVTCSSPPVLTNR
jgi:hypothetical protein